MEAGGQRAWSCFPKVSSLDLSEPHKIHPIVVLIVPGRTVSLRNLQFAFLLRSEFDLVKMGPYTETNSYYAYKAPTSSTARTLILTLLLTSLSAKENSTFVLVTGFPTLCPKVVTTTVSLVPFNRSSSASPFLIQVFL